MSSSTNHNSTDAFVNEYPDITSNIDLNNVLLGLDFIDPICGAACLEV